LQRQAGSLYLNRESRAKIQCAIPVNAG
jgi:hypothetical protein